MKYRLYNDKLCPDFWTKVGTNYVLKPEISSALIKSVNDFKKEHIEEAGVVVNFKDVELVGSSTNYNWSKFSDVDLHIIVDYSSLNMTPIEAEALFGAIKSNWNKKHKIKIKGHDLELNFENVGSKNSITSIYSLKTNSWVKKPENKNPSFNKELIKQKHLDYKNKIENAMRSKNITDLKKVLDKIYTFRQAGLTKGGELSEENIVFKILRAQGYLDRLKDELDSVYDEKMTVKERIEIPETSPSKMLIKNFNHPNNVSIDLVAFGSNVVSVEGIHVAEEARNKKIATLVFKQIFSLADKYDVEIQLVPSSDNSIIDLFRWYEKLGFKWDNHGYMKREPITKIRENSINTKQLAFHVTHGKFLSAILKNGLIPRSPSLGKDELDDEISQVIEFQLRNHPFLIDYFFLIRLCL